MTEINNKIYYYDFARRKIINTNKNISIVKKYNVSELMEFLVILIKFIII
jgi:hypothetical protein